MKEIRSINQLHSVVRRDVIASLFNKIPDYKLVLPTESEAKNKQMGSRLNRYKNDCGCFTGGIFMGLSVIFFTSYFLLGEVAFLDLDWYTMLGVVGIVFASSLAGKIVGLLWAKVQMVRTVRRLEFSVNNE